MSLTRLTTEEIQASSLNAADQETVITPIWIAFGHYLVKDSENEYGITFRCLECQAIIALVFEQYGEPHVDEYGNPPDENEWYMDACSGYPIPPE